MAAISAPPRWVQLAEFFAVQAIHFLCQSAVMDSEPSHSYKDILTGEPELFAAVCA
jgi:hypothetical protein